MILDPAQHNVVCLLSDDAQAKDFLDTRHDALQLSALPVFRRVIETNSVVLEAA